MTEGTSSSRLLLLGLWKYLSRRRRIQIGFLLIVMVVSGVAELVSLGAVIPFLAVLSNPDILFDQPYLKFLASHFGYIDSNQLVIPVTLIFVATAIFAALVRLINLRLNVQLAAAIGSDLSCEVYEKTLNQPYSVHVKRSSPAIIAAITTQITTTVSILNALLQTLTATTVSLGLFTGLIFIDSVIAFLLASTFGLAYCFLALTVRRKLKINSAKIENASRGQIKVLQEGLGAIRDVILDGSQSIYINIFRNADFSQRRLRANNFFLSAFPRFSVEALGIVLIASLGAIFLLKRGNGMLVVPMLGAIALGAQKLLPALQQIYSSWATFNGNSSAIKDVINMLNQTVPERLSFDKPLLMVEGIKFKDIHFSYELNRAHVLKGLNFEFFRGETIGLIGSTGSGKSTIVDILMGLLRPTSGQLLIDGNDLHDNDCPERLPAWRASIAHVPQSIYLADSSIAENIAFGVPKDQIDMARVREAAEQAQIAGFIDSRPQGYSNFVGEHGIRLSGGQRQRIGIARALYKQAQILVFDEATSALDTDTELAVMKAIEGLSKDLTVIIIAHRLSTVAQCDRVFEIKNGRAFERPVKAF